MEQMLLIFSWQKLFSDNIQQQKFPKHPPTHYYSLVVCKTSRCVGELSWQQINIFLQSISGKVHWLKKSIMLFFSHTSDLLFFTSWPIMEIWINKTSTYQFSASNAQILLGIPAQCDKVLQILQLYCLVIVISKVVVDKRMHANIYILQQCKVCVMHLIVSRFFSNMVFTQSTIAQTVLNSEFLKR